MCTSLHCGRTELDLLPWIAPRPGDKLRQAMFDYGFATFASKDDLLRRAEQSWNPGKTRFWSEAGIDW